MSSVSEFSAEQLSNDLRALRPDDTGTALLAIVTAASEQVWEQIWNLDVSTVSSLFREVLDGLSRLNGSVPTTQHLLAIGMIWAIFEQIRDRFPLLCSPTNPAIFPIMNAFWRFSGAVRAIQAKQSEWGVLAPEEERLLALDALITKSAATPKEIAA